MLPCNTTGHNNKSNVLNIEKKIYKKDNNNSEKLSLQFY